MRRKGTRFGIALALALLLPLTALAGGWAVVTLDSTPASVEAGKTFELGFTVLQHGKTPLEGLSPRLNFSLATAGRAPGLAKGETYSVVARASGDIGHYVASVTLPSEGTWNWEVEAFGAPAKMSALTVAAPAAARPAAPETAAVVPAPQPASAIQPALLWVAGGLIALVLVGAALLVARRRIPARRDGALVRE